MFSPVSVCLSDNSITQKLVIEFFNEIFVDPQTNRVVFGDADH